MPKRDPINILYYPDFFVDDSTLIKAILLFDELHFMDRPSMMFGKMGRPGLWWKRLLANGPWDRKRAEDPLPLWPDESRFALQLWTAETAGTQRPAN